MPSRGLRGLCVRGVAAAAASLLALSSTGALVRAAVISSTGPVSPIVLVDHGNGGGNGNGNGEGNGNGNQDGNGHQDGNGVASSTITALNSFVAKLKATKPVKPPKATPAPASVPKTAAHPKAGSVHSTASLPASVSGHTPTPPAAPKVVVDSSDPAPFSAQTVAVADAARLLPVERLGPLSGISFGSGLFIWPLLLAIDVFAMAVIARMALRRRLVSPED